MTHISGTTRGRRLCMFTLALALAASATAAASAQQQGQAKPASPTAQDPAGQQPSSPPSRDIVFDMGQIAVVAGIEGQPGLGSVVLTNEQMWTFDRKSLDQAVNVVPGVVSTFDANGRRNESDIFVRGFGRWQVPLMVDGVRIYLPADNRLDFSRFLTADIAEIQIQKGYASVLDGPGAMGGAINLVTRKPTKAFEAEGSVWTGGRDSAEGWNGYLMLGTRQPRYYVQGSANYSDRNYWSRGVWSQESGRPELRAGMGLPSTGPHVLRQDSHRSVTASQEGTTMMTLRRLSRCWSYVACAVLLVGSTLATAQAPSQDTAAAATLSIAGDVKTALSITPAELKAMPRTIVEVKGEDGRAVKYEGVVVGELLKRAGATLGSEMRGDALTTYVLASASDGYQVLFSLAELDPAFTSSAIIVADTIDGKPLFAYQGPFRIVAPRDARAARSIRMLQRLEVVRVKKER